MSLSIKYEHRQNDLYAWDHTLGRVLDYRTPHIHTNMELIFYHGGSTEVTVDSVRYQPEEGDAILIFPNQIHSYVTKEAERFQLFLLKPELVPELAEVLELGTPASAVIKGAGNHPHVVTLYRRLAELCNTNEEIHQKKQMLRGYSLTLLSELISRMTIHRAPRTDSDTLRSIIHYCTKHYNEDLSLSTLEEQLHLNKYYISHLFSGRLGLRFNDYINSLRITEACRLLLNTEESITSICDRVGFNTLRTFNRAFMKQIKLSPSEYRRQDRLSVSHSGLTK